MMEHTVPAANATPSALRRFASNLFNPDRLQANAARVGVVLLACWAAIAVPGFATSVNISAIMYATAAIGIAAVGMSLITLSGNLFMLSMGATTAVSTVVFAATLYLGLPASIAIVACVGFLIGLAQGIVVAVAKANPIITTIAAASIVMGLGAFYSGGLTVVGQGDASWLAIGSYIPGVPNQILIFLAFALVANFVVERTRLGNELRLVGLNAMAGEYAWLRTRTALILAYVLATVAAALAGALYGSQAAQGNLRLGAGIDFDAIAAVLVGGISIKGGRGLVIDAAIGAVFLALVSNILLLNGLSLEIQLLMKGFVVLCSVVLGALAQRMGRQ